MLKKLRIKFVILNMVTVSVVLAIVFAAICVIDHQQSVARVFEALDSAVSHVGDIGNGPVQKMSGQTPLSNAMASGTEATTDSSAADQNAIDSSAADSSAADPPAEYAMTQQYLPPEIGGRQGGQDNLIPVAVYILADDGSTEAAKTHTTASIDDNVLAQATALLTDAAEGSGSLENLGLFYNKHTVANTTYLAFADMSAASGWQNLALTLTVVGVVALAVFFMISLFFSRWALRPVTQAWNQQRQFVADASHDLKTPLTVILANSSILLEHSERSIASQSQWIESTQHEAESMQVLVGDLLLLAQIDEDGAKPTFSQVDLTDLVEGELLQFESVAFERNIKLDATLDSSVLVYGDTTRLRRLVATLLDNACKYTDDEGHASATLRQTVRAVELSVHNTGPVICAEDLPHVFDRFYRADKARTRDDSGHGLGLAIAHAIAQEHGGTLTVDSAEERGTTFTVTFPLIDT